MKTFFKVAWAVITSLFASKPKPVSTDGIPDGISIAEVEHAIVIVNNVRAAMASPLAVVITDLIPGTIDNTIREQLVKQLPVVSAGLTYAKNLIGKFPDGMVLNSALNTVKESDQADQDAFAHNLAARMLMIVTGGRINWSNAVMAVEYYFKNLYLKAV
ncbi:hypothetical protein [Mucilaginibacter glaciei]|uniref:Uncharacterized protein n=1 Tax=Mucilaginibacter glaciei TaxID=2772109 RepID=A0A926NRY9_9SPHI|nr:hypothetical protein [Mucilaginibacter glaciei]MBD1394263.1 hypothetical protein [Mucilaginibacter glaciei]